MAEKTPGLLDLLAKLYVQPNNQVVRPEGSVIQPTVAADPFTQPMAQPTQQAADPCGPEPPRPNYYSPQPVRDAYYSWQMCKMGG